MDASIKNRLLSKDMWLRAGLMILFGIVGWYLIRLVFLVVFLIGLVQIGLSIFTGNPNQNVLQIGKMVSTYLYQVFQFLTFATDEKPYPFSIWLSGKKAE